MAEAPAEPERLHLTVTRVADGWVFEPPLPAALTRAIMHTALYQQGFLKQEPGPLTHVRAAPGDA